MPCRIHISFRNVALSESVENACWREVAPVADLPDIEHCRLRIESVPVNGGIRMTGSELRHEIIRISLDFRIHGNDIDVSEDAIKNNGAIAKDDLVIAAVCAAVKRGLAAARLQPGFSDQPGTSTGA